MTYLRELALALRSRGADEDLVASVVREVEGLRLPEATVEQELGPAGEYAEQLVPRVERKRGGPLVTAGVVAAGAWLLIAFTAPAWGWDAPEQLGPFLLLPAVGAMAAGIVGQFLSDYLRPPRD